MLDSFCSLLLFVNICNLPVNHWLITNPPSLNNDLRTDLDVDERDDLYDGGMMMIAMMQSRCY